MGTHGFWGGGRSLQSTCAMTSSSRDWYLGKCNDLQILKSIHGSKRMTCKYQYWYQYHLILKVVDPILGPI